MLPSILYGHRQNQIIHGQCAFAHHAVENSSWRMRRRRVAEYWREAMADKREPLKRKSDTTNITIIAGLSGSGDNDRRIRQACVSAFRHYLPGKADVMNLMGAAA